jgi:hypothetical protein
MTKWRMCLACWIPKATNTLSEYVILAGFCTAAMVERTRLDVALYVNCLFCHFIVRRPDEGAILEPNLVARILLKVACV